MISSSTNPSGEIRGAALDGPGAWVCMLAQFKGKKIHSTCQGRAWPRGAPLAACFSSSLCRWVWHAAPEQLIAAPRGQGASMGHRESIQGETWCLGGTDWTTVWFKERHWRPSGKWCSAELRTQTSLCQESSCLDRVSTVWGCVSWGGISHPKHPPTFHARLLVHICVLHPDLILFFKEQLASLHRHYC